MPKLLKPPKFENVDDTTFDHYASAGMLAGEKAGLEFKAWCKPDSGKDPLKFPTALGDAIISARTQMMDAGATQEQCDLWTWAFREALAPHIAGYEQHFSEDV